MARQRCNDLVISWLLFNLDENIARSVLFLKTARAIWRDLEERFGYASMPQISSLEQKLADLHQEQLSVSEFYTKLKTIWDSLNAYPLPTCTCEKCSCKITGRIQKMQQEQRVLQFFMKLNDNFSAVRGNILMMTPMLNVTQAYRLVAQEENHKEMSQQVNQTDTLAFVADRTTILELNFNSNTLISSTLLTLISALISTLISSTLLLLNFRHNLSENQGVLITVLIAKLMVIA